jgi:hypothetical protein
MKLGCHPQGLDACYNSSRRVNSGVMSALCIDSQLNSAAPPLNDVELAWIIREDGSMWRIVQPTHDESSWHSFSAITLKIEKESFGAAGHKCSDITSHWTEARVSWPLVVDLIIVGLCARSVNSGVRPFAMNNSDIEYKS